MRFSASVWDDSVVRSPWAGTLYTPWQFEEQLLEIQNYSSSDEDGTPASAREITLPSMKNASWSDHKHPVSSNGMSFMSAITQMHVALGFFYLL